MSLIPNDYKDEMEVSEYFKLEPGENIVRILDDEMQLGYEYWVDKDGNPVERGNMAGEGSKPMRIKQGEKLSVELAECLKTIWACLVYNKSINKVQVWSITQASIRKAINALDRSKSWGDVKEYDISITKTGEKKETRYATIPCPKEELGANVWAEHLNMKERFDWDKWWASEDPFTKDEVDIDKVAKEIK